MNTSMIIDGEEFAFEREREKSGVRIYGNDRAFVRIGAREQLVEEFSFHKKLQTQRFPVPQILNEGQQGNEFFYVEESLGNQSFAMIFAEETKRHGAVTDKTFDEYLKLVERFAEAQLSAKREVLDKPIFLKRVRIPSISQDLPHLAPKIQEGAEKVMTRISKLPIVPTHLDLTPYNAYPKGIIDFGSSLAGPFGFDLTSAYYQHFFYPDSFPYKHSYRFTEAREARYMGFMAQQGERAGFDLPQHRADFLFLWAARFCVWLDKSKWPELRSWRYKKMENVLDRYLNDDFAGAVVAFKSEPSITHGLTS